MKAVQEGLGLSASSIGLLTTLPLLCFGIFGPLAPKLSRRFGNESLVVAMLLLLASAIVLRAFGSIGLFAVGLLHEITGSWTTLPLLFTLITAGAASAGLAAGRNGCVLQKSRINRYVIRIMKSHRDRATLEHLAGKRTDEALHASPQYERTSPEDIFSMIDRASAARLFEGEEKPPP